MFQQTPSERVLFPRGLKLAWLGVFVILSLLFSIFGIFIKTAPVSAAASSTINFQARLENASGSIAPDGNYNVQFKLYNVSTGGSSLWTETYQNSNSQGIAVKDGYLSVSLGSITAFPNTINWDQDLWVTLNIGGTTTGASPTYDGEMNPRLHLTSVPYAFRAGQLATYNNSTGFTSTLQILQPTVGNQVFQIPDQGAAGTYNLCVQGAATGCTAASGSTYYIQNQSASPQTANFHIPSSSSGAATAVLQGASGQTADLLTFKDASNVTVADVYASGGINTKNGYYVNGTQIIDSSGNYVANGSIIASSVSGASQGGSNAPGNNLTLSAGNGTGSGGSGDVIFYTAPPNSGYPAIGTTTQATNGNATSMTVSHTVTSGTVNRLLIVEVNIASAGVSVTGVTYGGTALSLVGAIDQSNTQNRTEMWYLTAPAIGTANVVVNLSGPRAVTVTAINVSGVNQTTPLGTAATAQGSNVANPSASVTATATDTVLDVMTDTSAYTALGSGQTSIFANVANTSYGSSSYKNGANGTVTNSYTAPSANWSMVAVPIHSASNATSPNTMVDRLHITSQGLVGINNANPQYQLDVVGDINTSTQLRIGGTVMCTSSGCTAAAGSGSYIQNQTASSQAANFKINGTGTAATLQASTFDTAAAGTLSVGTMNATNITLGSTTSTGTITVGQSTATNTINIGNATIAAGSTGTINIGTSSTGTGKTVTTIGSTNDGSSVLIQAGTGNLQIQTQGGTLGIGNNAIQQALTIGNSTSGTSIAINAGTGGVSIGNNAIANTIQIGSNSGTAIQALNIGNTTNAGTAVSNVTIGTTVGASATTIQAGTGNINLTTNNSGAGTFVKTLTNTTQAFLIQNASSNPIFNADTTTGNITLSQGSLTVNGIANPASVTLSTAATGGTVAAGTYYYLVSAIGLNGETQAIASSPASVTTTGTTSVDTVSWSAVTYATGYKVYRSTNNSTWFVNSVGSGVTSISDNGSAYTWSTSGTPSLYKNATGNVYLQGGASILWGANGYGAVKYDAVNKFFVMGNIHTGESTLIQGDTIYFENSAASITYLSMSASGVTINGVLTSTVATGTAPLSVASTTMVANLNVQYLNGWSESQLAQNLRSGYNLTGGGTVTYDGSGNLNWTQRFIVIANGSGSDFSTAGFYDIVVPASGTVITGVGGAGNVTAGSAGVPIPTWSALYYILPIGGNNTTVNANFRIATYTAGMQVPSNWVLLAVQNGDNSTLRLGTGITLRSGQSTTAGSVNNSIFNTSVNIGNMAATPYTLDVANNIHVCGSGTNCSNGQLFFGDNAFQYGSSSSDANNPWIGETGGDSDILTMSGSAGIQFQTSYTTDTFHYTSLYTETGHFCINNTTCTHQLGVNGNAAASGGFATGTPDIAEYITTSPDVQAYDVVAADPNNYESVVKATSSMKNAMVGVISDGTSGFMMQNAHYGQAYDATNQNADSNAKPMTLAGRIPVHVTNENGAIQPGDYLTVSATMPGYAMKATQAGPTIGKALGFFNQSSGTVLALINLSYYNPYDGNHLQAQSGSFDTLVASSVQFGSLNVSGATTLASLTVSGNASFQGDLTVAGTLTSGSIVVNGHIVTSGQAPAITVGEASGKAEIVNGTANNSTAPSVSVAGTDTAGTITLTTGGANLISGALAHVNFVQGFSSSYMVTISANNGAASKLQYYVLNTPSGFDVVTDGVAQASTQYRFNYIVLGTAGGP